MSDRRVSELLDQLTPRYDDRAGDWEGVATAASSSGSRKIRSWWLARFAAVAAVAAAVAAVLLAWPFAAEQGVLDRALAAVGDGPVLHVVLRGEWGGTLVDLETGERTLVHGENEIWYDTERGRVHSLSRLGDVVQHEELYEPQEPPIELVALGRDYRQALESGTARVAGEATVDGEEVVWVTIRSELLPDVADGKDHEFAHQVAVSRRTFKPVALRSTRDGQPGPGTMQRVLGLELLPAGAGDFTASDGLSLEGTAFSQRREPITVAEARETLGRNPFWLGRDYAGLPLAQVFRETTSSGRRREVKITGPMAQAAIECSKLRGKEAGDCFRKLRPTSALSVRADGVFRVEGPVVWSDHQTALVLAYGHGGDGLATYPNPPPVVPPDDSPHLTITQTTRPSPLRHGTGRYVPPRGSVFIAAGGRMGLLQKGGVQIAIGAADEDAIIAAGRALEPMTR